MTYRAYWLVTLLVLGACAQDAPYNPLDDYEEVDATTILNAPTPSSLNVAPENREAVSRGQYLVELLGCGACHTDGALIGEPNMDRALAGSGVGIAYANPLGHQFPGILYPPNITPDNKTGIGLMTNEQIALAIRAGVGQHGGRRILVMPWQGYASISNDDAYAIVGYLRSIKAVEHKVPDEVQPGTMAAAPYVYFGVYQSR